MLFCVVLQRCIWQGLDNVPLLYRCSSPFDRPPRGGLKSLPVYIDGMALISSSSLSQGTRPFCVLIQVSRIAKQVAESVIQIRAYRLGRILTCSSWLRFWDVWMCRRSPSWPSRWGAHAPDEPWLLNWSAEGIWNRRRGGRVLFFAMFAISSDLFRLWSLLAGAFTLMWKFTGGQRFDGLTGKRSAGVCGSVSLPWPRCNAPL